MPATTPVPLTFTIRDAAHPLTGSATDYDALLELIGEARAEHNARLVKNSEEYHRTMFRGRISSWNLRDRHMAETLEALIAHYDQQGGRSKVVVWEYNSHIGDARATAMGDAGECNVGQLSRERFGGWDLGEPPETYPTGL